MPSSACKATGCWQDGLKCVRSLAPPVHVVFSWCKSRPAGKLRCDTHPGDPSLKGARRGVVRGWGAAWAVSQIREQVRHSRQHALTAIEAEVSFTLCLLVFSWHVEREPPHQELEMSYRGEKPPAILAWVNTFVSKIHTSHNLEFKGPDVWVIVKIIYVKIKKKLPVTTHGSSPS